MTWRGDAYNPDPVEELMRDERRYGQEPDRDEVAEQYESDFADAVLYGSVRLAKQIRRVLDSFISPNTDTRKREQLLRISQLIDEVILEGECL
tara:strand:+ start:1821 stop:2099 length:279 start_codon:yes stop_codon:yes gene_type:complete